MEIVKDGNNINVKSSSKTTGPKNKRNVNPGAKSVTPAPNTRSVDDSMADLIPSGENGRDENHYPDYEKSV